VDTPGAHPGPAAEAAGIAGEIARTFAALDELPTVSVAVCVGEGGSGGALAFAHADRLLMLRHSVFSVIGPEGAAAIIERDVGRAPELAEWLRLTAPDLAELGIADEVVDEDAGAVGRAVARALDTAEPGDRRARLDRATATWVR
jgi:acetyl-CoA carboxylase alpha subunit